MTIAAKKFNEKYNLNITDASFKTVKDIDHYNDLSGKPKKNITQVFKRFFKTPWAVASLIVFIAILTIAIVVSITSNYSPNNSISQGKSTLSDVKNLKGTGIITEWVDQNKIQKINNYIAQGAKIPYTINQVYNGMTQIAWNPYNLVSAADSFDHYSIIGTDDLGRDIWTRTWVGTLKSLGLAILVVTITTTVGTLLGSWIGLYVGTILDILFMKIIAIYNSIPTIIWYTLILFLLPPGWISLLAIFILTGWMRGMGTARVYMWKYVNSDFMKAAEISGVSTMGIIIKHALPNYVGIISITFVTSIPAIIEAEASLAFLGFSPNPTSASLGNVINEAQKAVRGLDHFWYLLLPTIIIFTMTMALKYVAIGINDAVDPKFARRK